jgi:type III secretion protein V
MPYKNLQKMLMAVTARSDIMLAVFLVTIAFMMILPMPTLLIDILIGLNLSGSILLLMLAVYISSPLMFSAFPAVLLLTTLFRLALSISTTRLILLQADAGQIVQTFGDFVVSGNLVVGFVVFLIITIVQFIVITKGSERVAEVSARFSLDAMPGKQMSIDSDLRSGLLTLDEARKRRSNLEKESQLFGSMDGAMKFVKGDAIAGLIIIFVNIIGGISVGIMQNNMDFSSATELYSILTIGDGLVAQIPALFIAITAGIIVTRVTVDDKNNLGEDIGKQILAQPKALLAASAVAFLMGFVPGFPTAVFLVLAIVLGTTGYLLQRVRSNHFQETETTTVMGKDQGPGDELELLTTDAGATPSAAVLVEISEKARAILSPKILNADLIKVRKDLYNDLGILLPGIALRFVAHLPDGDYIIHIQDVPAEQGNLGIGKVFVDQTKDELDVKRIPYQQDNAENKPANTNGNMPSIWVEPQHSSKLVENGIKTLPPGKILSNHVAYALRKHAGQLMGIQEAHKLFNKLESSGYGELLKETQSVLSNPIIADVMKRLVDEQISIRNLRQVMESLIRWGEKEKDPIVLTEHVRSDLKRQITYAFSAGTNRLPAYLLTPDTENTIRSSIRQSPTGAFLALDQDVSQQLLTSLKAEEDKHFSAEIRPVLLTTSELRRYLKEHITPFFNDLPVLSFQELTPHVTLEPAGNIELKV